MTEDKLINCQILGAGVASQATSFQRLDAGGAFCTADTARVAAPAASPIPGKSPAHPPACRHRARFYPTDIIQHGGGSPAGTICVSEVALSWSEACEHKC
jgi:hypothetical protein